MHAGGAKPYRAASGDRQQPVDDEERRRLDKQDADQNHQLFNEYVLKMQEAIRGDYTMTHLKESNFPRYQEKLQELEDRLLKEIDGREGVSERNKRDTRQTVKHYLSIRRNPQQGDST